jgi:hypothetical protein
MDPWRMGYRVNNPCPGSLKWKGQVKDVEAVYKSTSVRSGSVANGVGLTIASENGVLSINRETVDPIYKPSRINSDVSIIDTSDLVSI